MITKKKRIKWQEKEGVGEIRGKRNERQEK